MARSKLRAACADRGRRELATCAAARQAGASDGPAMRLAEALVAPLVVPHGLTDLWALPAAPTAAAYALCGALGALCPRRLLPLLGACASVAHFAADLGWPGSCALVLLCAGCHARQRDGAAYCALLGYMLCVHLPRHYLRVAPATGPAGWALLAVFAGASWAARPLALLRGSALCRRAAVALVAAHAAATG